MVKTGQSGATTRAGKAVPAAPPMLPRTAALRSQPAATKAATGTSPGAEGHRLVQLSVRVTEADRRLVHRTALDLGMDAQELVIAALRSCGVQIGMGAPMPPGVQARSVRRPENAGESGRGKSGEAPVRRSSDAEVIDAARAFAVDIVSSLVAVLAGRVPGKAESRQSAARNAAQHQSQGKRK